MKKIISYFFLVVCYASLLMSNCYHLYPKKNNYICFNSNPNRKDSSENCVDLNATKNNCSNEFMDDGIDNHLPQCKCNYLNNQKKPRSEEIKQKHIPSTCIKCMECVAVALYVFDSITYLRNMKRQ